ncbi:MAG: YbaB/EbfC family nucleoid-associated protein [Pseudomonadota bacterium]
MDDLKMPDLGGLMQAAQRMQQEMARAQEELATKTVEASAGGGMVSVVANGRLEIISVTIDPTVVDPKEIEMLQDLVAVAVNQALARARELAQRELSQLAGGMALPDLTTLI